MAPPSGPNLICKNPQLRINKTNQSQGACLRSVNHSVLMLLAALLPQTGHTVQCPSPAQVQCLLLPGQIRLSSNCKQWRRTDNNNRAKNAPPLPTSKRRTGRLTKKRSVKTKNWTESERKHDQISEPHFRGGGAVGFLRT